MTTFLDALKAAHQAPEGGEVNPPDAPTGRSRPAPAPQETASQETASQETASQETAPQETAPQETAPQETAFRDNTQPSPPTEAQLIRALPLRAGQLKKSELYQWLQSWEAATGRTVLAQTLPASRKPGLLSIIDQIRVSAGTPPTDPPPTDPPPTDPPPTDPPPTDPPPAGYSLYIDCLPQSPVTDLSGILGQMMADVGQYDVPMDVPDGFPVRHYALIKYNRGPQFVGALLLKYVADSGLIGRVYVDSSHPCAAEALAILTPDAIDVIRAVR